MPVDKPEDDETEFPALGITEEAIQAERRATLKAKKDARDTKRLSQPPATVEDAWSRHLGAQPRMSREKFHTWFRENGKFEFDGTMWRRERVTRWSSKGKTRHTVRISYHGDDGRVETTIDLEPERRQDPNRNWRLPDTDEI
jgi:hypothetical protein